MLLSSGSGVNEVLELAAEIADAEQVALKDALKRACAWWSYLEQDAAQDARYRLTAQARELIREDRTA